MRSTLISKIAVMFVAVALTFGIIAPANAQAVLTSAVGTSTLSYSQGESITISGVPAALTFDPVTATTQVLNITTTWQLNATRIRVGMNLFFAVPATAMSDGAGHSISAAGIGADKNGDNSFAGCNKAPDSILTGVIPVNAACNVGDSVNITAANLSSTVTSQYRLKILNTGSLVAATYTGTLSYVAGAQ